MGYFVGADLIKVFVQVFTDQHAVEAKILGHLAGRSALAPAEVAPDSSGQVKLDRDLREGFAKMGGGQVQALGHPRFDHLEFVYWSHDQASVARLS